MIGSEQSKILVLGYGNTLRCDDAVGPLVVETVAGLRLPGVETLVAALLTPELADPISRAATIVFVDAAMDAPREVQLRPCAPAETSQIMAHAADPKTMLALARDVFGHTPEAYLLTIPVENLAIGEELSPLAREGMARAVEVLRGLAQGLQNE
jgi:hydrogenase maturation protease